MQTLQSLPPSLSLSLDSSHFFFALHFNARGMVVEIFSTDPQHFPNGRQLGVLVLFPRSH